MKKKRQHQRKQPTPSWNQTQTTKRCTSARPQPQQLNLPHPPHRKHPPTNHHRSTTPLPSAQVAAECPTLLDHHPQPSPTPAQAPSPVGQTQPNTTHLRAAPSPEQAPSPGHTQLRTVPPPMEQTQTRTTPSRHQASPQATHSPETGLGSNPTLLAFRCVILALSCDGMSTTHTRRQSLSMWRVVAAVQLARLPPLWR